jgi:MoaA/NifB/PqqE/SkfB family radical SAM enzyme
MQGLIAVTYRCNARCHMCNTWQFPTRKQEELRPEHLASLPPMNFTNLTGGEPFLRRDLEDIIEAVRPKSKRIVISTNGFFTSRIINIAKKYPDLGVRISIEGLPRVNDELRGIRHGFDKGLRTLLELKDMGMRDIGFGITLSDRNARDLLSLYRLAKAMGLEFATAATHNAYYFHKFDNAFAQPEALCRELDLLIADMLKSSRPKNWFRAYFNYGLQNFIRGGKRLLPCEAGTDIFFVDPFGEVRPCNAMDESMGNIREAPFAAIWHSDRAQAVRSQVITCEKNCWMIGTVAPAMKKRLWIPLKWVVERKLGLRSRAVAGEPA